MYQKYRSKTPFISNESPFINTNSTHFTINKSQLFECLTFINGKVSGSGEYNGGSAKIGRAHV